jgi:hypothetical protein
MPDPRTEPFPDETMIDPHSPNRRDRVKGQGEPPPGEAALESERSKDGASTKR